MNCSQTVEFIYSIVLQTYTICGRIYMQINDLPAGGAVVTRELDVSPVTHKTEICSQMLLYQTLYASLN